MKATEEPACPFCKVKIITLDRREEPEDIIKALDPVID